MNFIIGLLFFILLVVFVGVMIGTMVFPETFTMLDRRIKTYIQNKYPTVKED